MITVFVNGDARDVPEGQHLAELVDANTRTRSGVAVAVDGEVVPRTAWTGHALRPGAKIEILTAVQGG
jgi:sulfur carrier protein